MNIEFIEALEEMAKEKGIPREDLYAAIRKGLAVAYEEEHGEQEAIEVEIDTHSGDIHINGDRIELAKFGRIATKKAEETIAVLPDTTIHEAARTMAREALEKNTA